ncbi:YpmS family protein [Bacillus alveayuensis]|jgi:uncharacterized protein YpmS|uniref:Uncharacterized protein YpmS n=1 Tax=Aeribacillus alveayuensis TaxID=279215 RepID=A0ABT9VP83_9BACI|nr:YpmS family protein [Bacillus alveayuensis]MDQ0162779.1 uncharacterized protein YpmS [Bacillus alveayuensis]
MNKWKVSFILLLSVNIIAFLFVVSLMNIPKETKKIKPMTINENDYAVIQVMADKQTVTNLVNEYLQKEAKEQPLAYQISIEEDVKLYGSLKAFGRELQLTISFIPEVTADGNVVLSVHNMSVGKLSLPISYVLKYVEKHYELPEAVTIDSADGKVIVHLTDITLQNNYKILAGNIDLKQDQISAKLYVPYHFLK